MTGVEAVSNGVSAFRSQAEVNAQRTLTAIVGILIVLLAGIAFLSRAYGIGATEPGAPGYESILLQLTGAVVGRGVFYLLHNQEGEMLKALLLLRGHERVVIIGVPWYLHT
jgi:DMSO reductase anchor subunit